MNFLKLLSLTLLIAMTSSCVRAGEATLRIVNSADESIATLKIEVDGKVFYSENISPGKDVHYAFKVTKDASYVVFVKFSMGRELSGNIGYLTAGAIFNDTIVVDNRNIVLL